MTEKKKYYYLKLKDNFFDLDDIKILESMEKGIYYSNLLLKLYLKSLKNDGKLQYKEGIPYNEKMIATITNMDIDTVRCGLKILIEMGLIDPLSDGTMFFTDIQNFIGTSSSEGDRKREYRKRIQQDKNKLLGHLSDKYPPENRDKRIENRDKRIENRDKRIENRDKKKKIYNTEAKKVLDYFNIRFNARYTTKGNGFRNIQSRISEGYTYEDCIEVITKKENDQFFINNPKYLNPETLFRPSNFEKYLNEFDAPTREFKKNDIIFEKSMEDFINEPKTQNLLE